MTSATPAADPLVPATPAPARGRLLLAPLAIALVLLNPLSQLGYIPVSVVVGERIGIGAGLVGVTIGAHAVASGVGALVFGPLLDVVPVRRVLPAAIAVNAVAALAQLATASFAVLLAGRIATGLTTAVLMLAAAVMNADAHRADPGRRDRGFSQLQTFNSVGASLGLGIGALAAASGLPGLYFAVVAGYGALLLVLYPLIRRRLPAESPVSPVGVRPDRPLHDLPGDLAAMLGSWRSAGLLAAAAGVTWTLQAAHMGVALLVASGERPTAERVLLPMVIPLGVFLGTLLNQRLLRRRAALVLYRGYYLLLPVVMALLAGALAWTPLAGQVVALVAVGAVTGAMLPLSVAVFVGWYANVRSSAAAADTVAKALGSALSPVALGAATVAMGAPGAVLAVAASAALVGTVAVVGVSRSRPRADGSAPR